MLFSITKWRTFVRKCGIIHQLVINVCSLGKNLIMLYYVVYDRCHIFFTYKKDWMHQRDTSQCMANKVCLLRGTYFHNSNDEMS